MAFKHLSPEERHYIEIELRKGTSQNKIAESLGRSQGALSREINRNKGLRGYRHQQAHRKAQQRHKEKPKAVKLTEDIKRRITQDIRADWSPEQVAGRRIPSSAKTIRVPLPHWMNERQNFVLRFRCQERKQKRLNRP